MPDERRVTKCHGRLSFLPRDAMLSAVYAVYAVVVCLFVCLSHTPVLYQNG